MNYEIRRARNADIPALVEICRKSFHDRSMWQAPRFRAKRIWNAILSWDNNETWVCSSDSRVSGFVILVKEPVTFQRGWRQQKKEFWYVILSIILSPNFVRVIIWRKILSYYYRYKKHESGADIFQQTKENYLLLHLLAVEPNTRRLGAGMKLVAHSIQRAIELGKAAEILQADIKNQAARNLYEKMNFIYTHSSNEFAFYILRLNSRSEEEHSAN